MWIVRLALRNPYSVGVFAVVIFISGILSIASMLVDIFPVIDLPVVGVIWNYPGLSAEDMEGRVVTITERAFSTTVSGISRIESDSIPGIGNIRVYFESGTDLGSAIAQISTTVESLLRIFPPGMTAPAIFPFNASNIPVAQLTVFSNTIPEEDLFDYGLNFVRVQLFTIPGLATPAPYGGRSREIVVDVDPTRAHAKGISNQDVSNALQNSNLIIPAGDSRIGNLTYSVLLNASPTAIREFQNMPIRVINNRPVTLQDIAQVKNGYADQTNIVRINGMRATFLNIIKKSNASTLKVLSSIRKILPLILSTAPKGMEMRIDFDQSVFVKASIQSVIREALIAAGLVSLMVLIFLRSWQSVMIVCTSIPLSILVGIAGLKLSGQTINIMTLGGLSLAIGMLVDDATVEIENINRNIPMAPSTTIAILRGAHQIALPAIVSTLAICIVFFPIVLLRGAARFLFTPMAEAVVYSMLASYVLSRTLVPVLARMFLKEKENHNLSEGKKPLFEKVKSHYSRILHLIITHRLFSLTIFSLAFLVSLWIPFSIVGRDFFPTTDAGIMKFHFRTPSGTRLEATEKIIERVENQIRKIIPSEELETINSNIGVPTFYNLAFVPSDNIAQMDAEVLVALRPNHHPTIDYVRKIRSDLQDHFIGSTVNFQSADIVNQVLNFGLPAPIDIQVQSRNLSLAYDYAKTLRDHIQTIPGIADVIIKQVFDYPSLKVNTDRLRAAQVGLTEKDTATNLLVSLSTSTGIYPSYYLDPNNGVNYPVVVKVPLSKIQSVQDLTATPITPSASLLEQIPLATSASKPPLPPAQTLNNFSSMNTLTILDEISHVDVQRVVDVIANIDHRDLGSITSEIQSEIHKLGKLPAGTQIHVRGQSEVMNSSFSKLGLGMILAVLLAYLLMVTLFQSWLDPFIIMVAVPGALMGVLWMLALTGTSINVVSLMGSIMSIGIAVSNSNLLVTFANEIRIEKGISPIEAAIEAGITRLRPIIMTALAMILGMLPMAIGLGEGGEQNAPLGKAVIGGLIVATATTLFIVPILYSILRKNLPTKYVLQEHYRQQEKIYDEEEAHARRLQI